ncbi:MAG: hypothetical protein FWH05_04220 [Oscillospiraceae bacterium]|nr:hypothetical protein [Oscillospiraceae bacterium]
MTKREQCLNIVKRIPDEQLEFIAAILENAQKMIYEMKDDAYCLGLYNDSFDEKNNEPEDFSVFAKRVGIEI